MPSTFLMQRQMIPMVYQLTAQRSWSPLPSRLSRNHTYSITMCAQGDIFISRGFFPPLGNEYILWQNQCGIDRSDSYQCFCFPLVIEFSCRRGTNLSIYSFCCIYPSRNIYLAPTVCMALWCTQQGVERCIRLSTRTIQSKGEI